MESLIFDPAYDLELKLLVISISTEEVEIERVCLLPSQLHLRTRILEKIPSGYQVSVVPVYGVKLTEPQRLAEVIDLLKE